MPVPQGQSVQPVRVLGVEGEAARFRDDLVAAEAPLEIRLGYTRRGERHLQRLAVTMRTPGHDRELAVGFLVGEGVVRSFRDLKRVFFAPTQTGTDPNVVVVELAPHVTFDARRLERNVYATSSCGVCGKASLEAVEALKGPPLPAGPTLQPAAVHALPDRLRAAQAAFDQTGGLHAAALFDASGVLLRLREDVGRHNAVDKLVGAYLLEGAPVPRAAILLVSGRASFEILQKAVLAGLPVVAAVGAPSSLAVDLAAAAGVTLLGFVRGGRFNVYTGPERVAGTTADDGPPTAA